MLTEDAGGECILTFNLKVMNLPVKNMKVFWALSKQKCLINWGEEKKGPLSFQNMEAEKVSKAMDKKLQAQEGESELRFLQLGCIFAEFQPHKS